MSITLNKDEIDLYSDEFAYLNLDFENLGGLPDPFEDIDWDVEDLRYPLLDIYSNPKNFWLTCKDILNIDLQPFQQIALEQAWTKSRSLWTWTRGGSKTFLLALYIVLRCAFVPGTKIAVVAMGLRQSKNLFNYVKVIWDNAPLLRQMADQNRDDQGPHTQQDRFIYKFNSSQASFLPIGPGGATIRGERATDIIIDEYGDVPKSIVDTVVIGFAAVSADPSEKVKTLARIERMKASGEIGESEQDLLDAIMSANKVFIAGTGKPHFNHYAQEFHKYKRIVLSRGNKEYLKGLVDEDTLENLNPRDYSIFRLPYPLIPKGFMDDKAIALAKASVDSPIYAQEYLAAFPQDTQGFFKASLVYDYCTVNSDKYRDGELVCEPFRAMLYGDPSKSYILGFDPASQRDNAAFVIIELNQGHNRVVYCETTNALAYEEYKKKGGKDVGTYYQFCASRLIDLTDRFNIILMAIDFQGGGREIAQILWADDTILNGRVPIYPICDGHPLWNKKALPTDDHSGKHIIEPVQFANAQYTSDAHHSLRSDFENLRLLFPTYDAISLVIEDTEMEVCLKEIQEIKYELTILEYTVSPGGTERWDTPEVKQEGEKKGRLVNDRASALVMANYAARRLDNQLPTVAYDPSFAYMGMGRNKAKPSSDGWDMAPDWFRKASKDVGVARIIGQQ